MHLHHQLMPHRHRRLESSHPLHPTQAAHHQLMVMTLLSLARRHHLELMLPAKIHMQHIGMSNYFLSPEPSLIEIVGRHMVMISIRHSLRNGLPRNNSSIVNITLLKVMQVGLHQHLRVTHHRHLLLEVLY